jgi:hypothetical protein
MSDRTISVRLVSNEGAGENRVLQVQENMTVNDFVSRHLSGQNPEGLLIRVNGRSVVPEGAASAGQPTMATPLQANDKVTVAPKKVDGAN